MKIIDLLNKIANGLELPKKIKYDEKIWEMNDNFEDYAEWYCDEIELLNDYLLGHFDIANILTWKLEIIDLESEVN